jgi:hypothetical protein
MDDAQLMMIILFVGLLFGVMFRFLVGQLTTQVKITKKIIETNRKFKEKQAEVTNMKSNGDLHQWVTVPYKGEDVFVCKKTGWCPHLEGFLPVDKIASHLNDLKTEEDYQAYRRNRIDQLSEKMGMSYAGTEKLVEEIFSIKKDFYLGKLEALQKELEDGASRVKSKEN